MQNKMEDEWQDIIRSQHGDGYKKYSNELAVAVNKSGITLIGSAKNILNTTGWIKISINKNGIEWAMKPVAENEGGYKVSIWSHPDKTKQDSRVNKYHITATLFIRQYNLQIGGIYIGKVRDGMVVFSRLASELTHNNNHNGK